MSASVFCFLRIITGEFRPGGGRKRKQGGGEEGGHSAAALEGASSRKLVPTKKLRCPRVFLARPSDSMCAHSHTIDWQSQRVCIGKSLVLGFA